MLNYGAVVLQRRVVGVVGVVIIFVNCLRFLIATAIIDSCGQWQMQEVNRVGSVIKNINQINAVGINGRAAPFQRLVKIKLLDFSRIVVSNIRLIGSIDFGCAAVVKNFSVLANPVIVPW